jgi:hypothetical protein
MKEPLSSPGMQQVPRFPRKVYIIRDENVARMDDLDREVRSNDGLYPRITWEEPYAMRPESLQNLQQHVLAAIRDRFMSGAHVKPKMVH